MKKLYKKGKVHPSSPLISDHLAFLPATILTLAPALSPEDREVLAYLISCSGTPGSFSGGRKNTQNQKSCDGGGGGGGGGAEHPPLFHCDCFWCYTSYWARWNDSPNHQLIHDIIEAFEDDLLTQKKMKMKNNKKDRKNKKGSDVELMKKKRFQEISNREEIGESESVEINGGGDDGDDEIICGVGEAEQDLERGSMRKLISFVGERIWGVWGQ